MKTRNILIAVVLLVSFLSSVANAQTSAYTFTDPSTFAPGTTTITNIAQTFTLTKSPAFTYTFTLQAYKLNTAGTFTIILANDVLLFDDLSNQYISVVMSNSNTAIVTVNDPLLVAISIKCVTQNATSYFVFESNTHLVTGISNFTKKQELGLSVYPNPSTDKVNIKLNLGNDKKVKIFLYSIMGQLVFEDEYTPNATEAHELNVDKLSKGIYSLQVLVDGKSINEKIIKE